MNFPEWRVVRVMLAVSLIFVLGIFTGRWTAPRPNGTRFRPLPPPLQAQGSPDVAINHMLAYIDLTPDQIAAIRLLMAKWAMENRNTAPFSEERKEAFLKYVPMIRQERKPDQLEAYDAMTEATQIRATRRQRMRP